MSKNFDSFDVLGIPISVVDLDIATEKIEGWVGDRRGRAVGVREVPSIMAMRASSDLINVSHRTSMNLPDGMPLVWIGKILGLPVKRTCGTDIMQRLLLKNSDSQIKHFLYGGKPGVAEALAKKFRQLNPEVAIVGMHCPPFRSLNEEEDRLIVEEILASGANIVWVGMSSPKQDQWMDDHLEDLPVTMIGVGAAFDFLAGSIPRAPNWMQQTGLEWLHRLICEPRRLWRRYMILAPKFVVLALFSTTVKLLNERFSR